MLAPLVLKRLQAVPVADVSMSVVTKAECLYGVEVSPRRAQDAAALAALLPTSRPRLHGRRGGPLRGDSRGPETARCDDRRKDLFIAAHARALGLTLVTNNTAEFERVKGLVIQNWMLPGRRKR